MKYKEEIIKEEVFYFPRFELKYNKEFREITKNWNKDLKYYYSKELEELFESERRI
jgi:hypothetical protein